jgi:prophage antirepressor-like protein
MELQIFKNQDFGEIRTYKESDGTILFCGSDVAKALGYLNTRDALSKHCKEDGVAFHDIIDSMNRKQTVKFITKGNVCRLTARSKLRSAEKFECWIFDEVIPSVLEHGVYATEETLDNMINNPEFGIKLLTELKQEREEKKLLQEQIENQKPLVEFAKTVKGSDTNILVRETSKLASNYIGIDIGEQGLYQTLRDWGFVCKTKNEPTKKAYLAGILEYAEIRTRVYPFTACTTKVTPKGQLYIINRLIKEYVERTVA